MKNPSDKYYRRCFISSPSPPALFVDWLLDGAGGRRGLAENYELVNKLSVSHTHTEKTMAGDSCLLCQGILFPRLCTDMIIDQNMF